MDNQDVGGRDRAVRLAWRAEVVSTAVQRLGVELAASREVRDDPYALLSQEFDLALIAASGFFDAAYYLSMNGDVAEAGVDPLRHYLKYGGMEGRRPSPDFDGAFYLRSYEDVREAGLNPLVHYIKHGLLEDRLQGVPEIHPTPVRAESAEAVGLFELPLGRADQDGYAAMQALAAGELRQRRLPPAADAGAPRPRATADLGDEACLVRASGTSQVFLLRGRYPGVTRSPMSSSQEMRELGFDPDAVSEIPVLCLDAIPLAMSRSHASPEPHVVLISSAFAFGRAGQTIVLDALLGGSERTTLVSLREGAGLRDFAGRFAGPIVLAEAEPFYERHAPTAWTENSLDGNAGLLNRFGGMLTSLEERVDRLAERLTDEDVAAIVACSGDHPDLPVGAALARRLGVPFFAYLFDDPIFQWQDERLDGPHARLMERRWVTGAAGILTPNEELGRALWERNQDLAIPHPLIVRNPIGRGISIRSAPQPRKDEGEPWIIAYTGSVYHAQADAFRNLLTALDGLDEPWELHIASEQDAARIEREGISSPAIRLHGSLTREESVALQCRADVLFLPLAFEAIPDVIRTSAPLKTGEYLASGQPILVHAPADAWLSRFFRERGCGFVVDEPSPPQLAEALTRLRHERGLREALFDAQVRVAQEFELDTAQRAFRTAITTMVTEGHR